MLRRVTRAILKLGLALLVGAAALSTGCGRITEVAPAVEPEAAVPLAPGPTPTSVLPPTIPVEARTLTTGEFRLPAASSFGAPGFHEVLTAAYQVPADLGSTEGLRLVLRLRDVASPRSTCPRDQPLSGCATVDWSDGESRPNVPRGGVFDNSIAFRLGSGPLALFLSESGALNREPEDRFDPG